MGQSARREVKFRGRTQTKPVSEVTIAAIGKETADKSVHNYFVAVTEKIVKIMDSWFQIIFH